MDKHSVELLEFEFIRDELEGLCFGDEGRRLLHEQEFLHERDSLDTLLDRVVYIQKLVQTDSKLPAVRLPEIAQALEYVRKEGSTLDGEQIAAVGHFIEGGATLAKWVCRSLDDRNRSPFLSELASLPDLREVSKFIFSFLEEDGSVNESLPELKSLRRRMRSTQGEISSLASGYLQDQASIWQTDVPTQKDGRLVLPLKSSYKGRVPGIIREVSSSGATIFVEPFDLVEKNNAYALLEHEYQIEIARILRVCSARIRESRELLLPYLERMAELDTVVARARYGVRHLCTRPTGLDKGFCILSGRHPMLGKSVVPIRVELADGSSVLLISGPNAGGKTVSLKTIGLFALMNQFGMCIPADEGSSMQLYSDVFADIGDDQSIEESLSTFSGHMKNISRFTTSAADDVLVLLDELASGTDPEEGSAIAMAVLDHFIENHSTVVATTHQSALKNYAFSKDGVANASVSFDPETHRPTYSIILGLPGESHALDIAAGSGMSREIIDCAHRYLDEQSTDVAQIIREITFHQRSLKDKETDFQKKRNEWLERSRETDLRALRLKQRETELRTQGYVELTKQNQENRRQLENLVRDLREGELSKEKTRAVKEFIGEMEKAANKEKAEIAEVTQELRPAQDLAEGMDVLVGASRQRGTVVRKARSGYWVVATDKLKITVPESDIKEIVQKAKKEKRVHVAHSAGAGFAAYSLDLRGYRLVEALDELERQIDRAILGNLTSFEVIHGLGEGVLKQGIQDRLRSHPSVGEFGFALPDAGGFGKTIVQLKA
jgi:DNA mismatch repair protein MutS2